MLIIDKPKVASFAKRYFMVFVLGVCGWELAQFANSNTEFGLYDLFEAVGLFGALFSSVVLLTSFSKDWIAFRSIDDSV